MKTKYIIYTLILFFISLYQVKSQDFPSTNVRPTFFDKNWDSLQSTFNRLHFGSTRPMIGKLCDSMPAGLVIALPNDSLKYPIDTIKNPIDTSIANDPDTNEMYPNIYWLHGLNGTVQSWNRAALATMYGVPDPNDPTKYLFRPRKAISRNIANYGMQTYEETGGIDMAANEVAYMIRYKIPNAERTNHDFFITHSQGGIVAHKYLLNQKENPSLYPNYVHGLVTFGTPHNGAMIVNNTRSDMNNRLMPFLNNACVSLSKPTIDNLIQSNFFTNILMSNNMIGKLSVLGCNLLTNTVIPLAMDNYMKRTTLDYPHYSSYLNHPQNGINNRPIDVPLVQFYGEEEEPVFWRFLSSSQNIGEDQLSNKEQYFAYDKDDFLIEKVNNLCNEFSAQAQLNDNNMHSITGTWQMIKHFGEWKNLLDNYIRRRDDNIGAYNWLKNANDYYKSEILGVDSTVTLMYCVTETTKIYSPSATSNHTYTTTQISSNSQCPPSYSTRTYMNGNTTIEETKQVYSTYLSHNYQRPNDGVVWSESATKQISSTAPSFRAIMKRTNHDQMRNSETTRLALVDLYGGKYGRTFKLGYVK